MGDHRDPVGTAGFRRASPDSSRRHPNCCYWVASSRRAKPTSRGCTRSARHITFEPLSTITGAPPAPAPPAFGPPAGTAQSVAAAGIGFFDQLGDALAINPPTDPVERRTLESFSNLGIGPGRHPGTQVRDPRVRAALLAGMRIGAGQIAAQAGKLSSTINGWTFNLHIGAYGHDAALRAAVAETGWGANVPAEAVYAHAERDENGTPLNGADRYVVHFARGDLPPVKAFWSVTMYGPDLFFVANPINRYAIGSHTPGLRYNPDGSLDIYVQHERADGSRVELAARARGAVPAHRCACTCPNRACSRVATTTRRSRSFGPDRHGAGA